MMRHTLLTAAVLLGCTAGSNASPTPAKPNGPREVAILAGGCFWGMEHVMLAAPGIVDIEVGYAGGKSAKAKYEDVSEGTTGHAESIKVTFDPSVISYEDLLVHYYFRGHDPTTLDRQHNDVGTQYRSEIFTMTPAQAKAAASAKARVDKSGKWGAPVVTKIEPATTWIRAEEYHQDYLVKHPDGYNDHYLQKFDF
jgi:methionine-S-sulfoxide reductase